MIRTARYYAGGVLAARAQLPAFTRTCQSPFSHGGV